MSNVTSRSQLCLGIREAFDRKRACDSHRFSSAGVRSFVVSATQDDGASDLWPLKVVICCHTSLI